MNLLQSPCIGCWNEKGKKDNCIVDREGNRCEKLTLWQENAMKSISYGHPRGASYEPVVIGTVGIVPPKPRYYER